MNRPSHRLSASSAAVVLAILILPTSLYGAAGNLKGARTLSERAIAASQQAAIESPAVGTDDSKVAGAASIEGFEPPACSLRVLIVYADSSGAPTSLQSEILAEPGVAAADLFDATAGTPTLAQLQQYDVVAPFSNDPFTDAATLGDNLADYVDAGGIVVQVGFSFYGPGQPYGVNGRWLSGNYNPYDYSTNLSASGFTLGAFNAGHPLMAGVTTLNSNYQNIVSPNPSSTEVAATSNGSSLVAYRPVSGGHTTVGITAYLGVVAAQSGDWGRVIVNAGHWLAASCQGSTLSALSPAKVWVGLANSDDVGIKFDLQAIVSVNGTPVGSGHLDSVAGGSSGFNNAKLDAIPLTLPAPVAVSTGDSLSIEVFARNACVGSGHNNGRARLWFNGQPTDTGAARDAGSRFDATIAGSNSDYFLRSTSTLSTTAGASKVSADVAAGAKCSPFVSFGTWTTTLP